MKRLLFLSAILSVSAIAAPIGTCTATTLSNLLGNACALGGAMFSNFTYAGNVDISDINVNFQLLTGSGTEYLLSLTPVTGAGLFTNFTFTAIVSPNSSSAGYEIVSLDDPSNVSPATGSLLTIVNPSTIGSGVTTTAKLTGAGGTGDADPGLSSLDLDYLQTTVVPEPAGFTLIGFGLAGLSLVRKTILRA